MIDKTDKDWESFGANDPYFAVLTDDKFHATNLSEEHREDFFKSGEAHISHILETIRKHFDKDFSPKNCLDFGCGVGRLVIPLARVSQFVTGVDVSQSMLVEAGNNCQARSINNVLLLKCDDELEVLDEEYDFIHSFIVFQHIPFRRGEKILQRLLSHLACDGIGVLHFTIGVKADSLHTVSTYIKSHVPFGRNIINIMRGRKINAAEMQMNAYDLHRILEILHSFGICKFFAEFADDEPIQSIILYFKK